MTSKVKRASCLGVSQPTLHVLQSDGDVKWMIECKILLLVNTWQGKYKEVALILCARCSSPHSSMGKSVAWRRSDTGGAVIGLLSYLAGPAYPSLVGVHGWWGLSSGSWDMLLNFIHVLGLGSPQFIFHCCGNGATSSVAFPFLKVSW